MARFDYAALQNLFPNAPVWQMGAEIDIDELRKRAKNFASGEEIEKQAQCWLVGEVVSNLVLFISESTEYSNWFARSQKPFRDEDMTPAVLYNYATTDQLEAVYQWLLTAQRDISEDTGPVNPDWRIKQQCAKKQKPGAEDLYELWVKLQHTGDRDEREAIKLRMREADASQS
jgi:hypothetical protein